ncbi:Arabinogalactan protein 16/20/22/41 [Dioscorea alata]|uniref:Arabinogalactan protein 16/20/22/41 n=1 Tax=Dioscorea alata TaxID=55571 RepID=A0ACB7U1K9_DIOAL|nr:Arabinogalactan protein 16/20/22/41 [Dioscorea alata]
MSSVRGCALFIIVFFFSGLMELSQGQAVAPSPATGDGKALDQGIAYMSSVKACALFIIAFFCSGLIELSHGEAMAPSPATGDGKALDQGIAYVLMLVALLVTYLIH